MTSSPPRAAAYTAGAPQLFALGEKKKLQQNQRFSFFRASARHLRAPVVQSALLGDKTWRKMRVFFAVTVEQWRLGKKKVKTSIYLNQPLPWYVFFGTSKEEEKKGALSVSVARQGFSSISQHPSGILGGTGSGPSVSPLNGSRVQGVCSKKKSVWRGGVIQFPWLIFSFFFFPSSPTFSTTGVLKSSVQVLTPSIPPSPIHHPSSSSRSLRETR